MFQGRRYERLNTNVQDEDRLQDTIERNDEIILHKEQRHLNRQKERKNSNNSDSYRNGHVTNADHNLETSINTPQTNTSSMRLMHLAIGTLATIVLYLILSICLTFYQKSLLKKIGFPLTIVSYHFVIKCLLAAGVRAVFKCRYGKSRVQLDCRTAIRKMAPTGIASGIDIGFSNWGLNLVHIALYTMTKSSTIVFILFFAILLGLEKKSWLLMFTVGLIAAGLFMFTYKSTSFNLLGFIFILIASLCSGVRWSFAQFVMQKTKLGLQNPIDMIYHMQPWMILSLLPFAIVIEGQKLYDVLREISIVSNDTIVINMVEITFGAVLAFLMEVSEFLVISHTSSLTLTISGIFKDIFQLALAVEQDDDQLSLINIFGLILCLAGICCHLLHKYSTLTKIEEINAFNDNDEHDINLNVDDIDEHHQYNATTMSMRKLSSQTVPLLEQTDSDNSENDPNEQNASDVIFDVLKRRDMQR